MASTIYTDANASTPGTLVVSSWLNDVDTNTYPVLSSIAGTNTLTGTGPVSLTAAYPRGVAFRFLPVNANTGAVTININGLGAKAVTKYGTTPLVANDLQVGSWAYITYDGTQFQLVNPLSAVNGRLLNVQTFLASGTYTPTVGTTRIVVEGQGSGGGGGGAAGNGAGQLSIGAGGGAGGIGRALVTSGFAGTAVTIGAAGVGVFNAAGTAGSPSSFGAFLTLPGGNGGAIGPAAATSFANGGLGGVGTGNIFGGGGAPGGTVISSFASGFALSGGGGDSLYGGGGRANFTGGAPVTGENAVGRGAGGAGAASFASAFASTGGNGALGIIIVYEYS